MNLKEKTEIRSSAQRSNGWRNYYNMPMQVFNQVRNYIPSSISNYWSSSFGLSSSNSQAVSYLQSPSKSKADIMDKRPGGRSFLEDGCNGGNQSSAYNEYVYNLTTNTHQPVSVVQNAKGNVIFDARVPPPLPPPQPPPQNIITTGSKIGGKTPAHANFCAKSSVDRMSSSYFMPSPHTVTTPPSFLPVESAKMNQYGWQYIGGGPSRIQQSASLQQNLQMGYPCANNMFLDTATEMLIDLMCHQTDPNNTQLITTGPGCEMNPKSNLNPNAKEFIPKHLMAHYVNNQNSEYLNKAMLETAIKSSMEHINETPTQSISAPQGGLTDATCDKLESRSAGEKEALLNCLEDQMSSMVVQDTTEQLDDSRQNVALDDKTIPSESEIKKSTDASLLCDNRQEKYGARISAVNSSTCTLRSTWSSTGTHDTILTCTSTLTCDNDPVCQSLPNVPVFTRKVRSKKRSNIERGPRNTRTENANSEQLSTEEPETKQNCDTSRQKSTRKLKGHSKSRGKKVRKPGKNKFAQLFDPMDLFLHLDDFEDTSDDEDIIVLGEDKDCDPTQKLTPDEMCEVTKEFLTDALTSACGSSTARSRSVGTTCSTTGTGCSTSRSTSGTVSCTTSSEDTESSLTDLEFGKSLSRNLSESSEDSFIQFHQSPEIKPGIPKFLRLDSAEVNSEDSEDSWETEDEEDASWDEDSSSDEGEDTVDYGSLLGFEPVLCISKIIATPSSSSSCRLVASCNTNTVASTVKPATTSPTRMDLFCFDDTKSPSTNMDNVGCMSLPKKLRLSSESVYEVHNQDLDRANKNWRAIPAISRKSSPVVQFSSSPVKVILEPEYLAEDLKQARMSDFPQRVADKERMERLLAPIFTTTHRNNVFKERFTPNS